jgi:hypothetical protein
LAEIRDLLFAERDQTQALAEFRSALEELGLSQTGLASRMIALGDYRKQEAILRSIQRIAAGESRVPGEMQVVMKLLQREHRRAKRLANAVCWSKSNDGKLNTEINGVHLTITPQSRGRWSIHAQHGSNGYSPDVPHWRNSLEDAKIRAVQAVDETLDQMGGMPEMTTVYRFKVYDINNDKYMYPPKMATEECIAQITGASIIENSAIEVECFKIDGNGLYDPRI